MQNAQSFIDEINIQIINRCNLLCVFCPRANIPSEDLRNIEKTGVMTLELFKDIVDRCVVAGITKFSLTPRMGEVLIDPTLLDKLHYLEDNSKVQSYFFASNLTLDASDLINYLQRSKKLTLEVSHYGSLENFVKVTQGNKRFYDIYKKNLCLIAARIKHKSRITIFKRFVGEENVSIVKVLKAAGVIYDEKETKNFNIGGLLKNEVDEYTEIIRNGECPTKQTGCILINGDYNLCYMNDVYDTMTQGNILKKSLRQLRAEALLEGHEVCRKCNECW